MSSIREESESVLGCNLFCSVLSIETCFVALSVGFAFFSVGFVFVAS